jgi:hypothetical protein
VHVGELIIYIKISILCMLLEAVPIMISKDINLLFVLELLVVVMISRILCKVLKFKYLIYHRLDILFFVIAIAFFVLDPISGQFNSLYLDPIL